MQDILALLHNILLCLSQLPDSVVQKSFIGFTMTVGDRR